ncbi:pimeloyl-ACP methyl ester carboxylesterase [Hamadaea flava]|uniref:Alpha/beta fold hydrolase n=1 Tax=Hamadaea flava TaxID=1742688 RepID=A0ABV8LYX0_9ACTN|nr:alpha/beta hydrolase [Hamadaea flava]MCP2321589.1 pimeloyl-ACP methyl ester carboxylesterase [Hamadaea flava]
MNTYLTHDGAELHYERLGSADGEPIVVLAGGAAAHPSYLDDLAGLSGVRPLVVPQLRGVGDSPLPADPEVASFWRQAEDVDRLRRHLGLDRVVLLGHSAGTRLAISYAAQFPAYVGGLVLVTPPTGYLIPGGPGVDRVTDARHGEPAFDAAYAAWQTGPEQLDDDGLNEWYGRIAPMSYATWGPAEQAHSQKFRYRFAANRAYFSVDPPDDLAARLRAVEVPVLVVAGAQDTSVGVGPATELARLFPAGEIAVLDGSGHFPWFEQPAAFRSAVAAFL